MANLDELKEASKTIRDEEGEGQNTAQRVGKLFLDITEYIGANEAAWLDKGSGSEGDTPTPQTGGKSVTLYYSDNENGYPQWEKTFDRTRHLFAIITQVDSNGKPIPNDPPVGTGFRIVGEKGNGADYIDYKFGRSDYASLPSGVTVPPVDPSWDSANNGWGDYPPEPDSNYPYVWMKMTFRSWQNGNYVDTTTKYTRLTGVQGPAGESSVIADFDDEMISIPVSSTGATTYFDNNVTWTTRAYLYRGTKKLAIASYTISAPGVSCVHTKGDEGDANYIQVVVNGFSDTNTNNIKIEVNITATTGETGKCCAYINKIPSGSGSTPGEGEVALVYDLSIDTKSIKYNNDTYQPDNVVVKVRKTQGTSTSFLTNSGWTDAGYSVRYAFGSKITSATGGTLLGGESIVINSSNVGSNTMLYISLWKGSTMYDAETVHILKDGSVVNSYTLRYNSIDNLSGQLDSTKKQRVLDWHTSFQSKDIYAVEITIDGSNSISNVGTPFRMVGEQGNGAPYYWDYKFARNNNYNSANDIQDTDWQDAPPEATPVTPVLWMKTTKMVLSGTTYTEDSSTIKIARISGEPGPQGEMDTVISRVTYYVKGDASQPAESAFTSTTYPSPVSPGDYIWSKTVVTYKSNNTSVSYSISRIGADGTPEEVESFEVQYAVSESIVANPSTLNWQNEMPNVPKGSYLYTKTTITFKNSSTPIVFYSYSYQGMDGEDAAAYEFVRFSDDAKFVNGKWVGTFTDADSSLITQRTTNEGDERNLIPYSGFNELYQNNVPVGWMKNGADSATNNLTKEEVNGVTFIYFDTPSGNNFGGIVTRMSDIDGTETNKYMAPILPNTDYTLSVMYKGTGVVALGLHFMLWKAATETIAAHWYKDNSNNNAIFQEWESGLTVGEGETALLTTTKKLNLYYSTVDNTQDVTKWHAEYQAGDAYICAVRVDGSGTITEWGSVIPYAPEDTIYARVFLVHNYNSAAGSYSFAQPMLVKGTSAISYMPSPQEEMLGTVHGLWKGVLRWDKPYASTRFADYEWSRVRDAEPRMTAWRDLGTPQKPDLDNGEPNTSEATEYNDAYHTTFYCGAYGEPCYDMVYDGSDYWICTETYSWEETVDVAGKDIGIFPGDNKNDNQLWLAHWEKARQYNFLVAQTLVAMRAYIKLLTVDKLLTNGNNARVKIENGLITIESTEKNNDTNIRFGIDENGNVLLGYYSGDTLLYELGSKGYVKYEDVVKAYFTEIPIVAVNNNNIMSEKTLDIIADGNSQYRYFEGYTINSDGTKTYAISGNSDPSSANECLYTSNTKSGANDVPTGTLTPTGYYRTKRTNSTDLNIYMGDSSVLCYYDYVYHYRSDFKTILGTPYLFTLANGDRVAQVCDKNGYPCTIQQSYESIKDERFPDMIF